MAKQVSQRREISADIERDDAIGAATRAQIGQEAYELYVQQQCCGGLNFGYFYAGSPIIAYYRAAQPAYTMESFEIVVGARCRAPHFWLSDGRSFYDALGGGYCLIRFDPDIAVDGLVAAAKGRGIPLTRPMSMTRSLCQDAGVGAPQPACCVARVRGAKRSRRPD